MDMHARVEPCHCLMCDSTLFCSGAGNNEWNCRHGRGLNSLLAVTRLASTCRTVHPQSVVDHTEFGIKKLRNAATDPILLINQPALTLACQRGTGECQPGRASRGGLAFGEGQPRGTSWRLPGQQQLAGYPRGRNPGRCAWRGGVRPEAGSAHGQSQQQGHRTRAVSAIPK